MNDGTDKERKPRGGGQSVRWSGTIQSFWAIGTFHVIISGHMPKETIMKSEEFDFWFITLITLIILITPPLLSRNSFAFTFPIPNLVSVFSFAFQRPPFPSANFERLLQPTLHHRHFPPGVVGAAALPLLGN